MIATNTTNLKLSRQQSATIVGIKDEAQAVIAQAVSLLRYPFFGIMSSSSLT
jgi:hypothetical protein